MRLAMRLRTSLISRSPYVALFLCAVVYLAGAELGGLLSLPEEHFATFWPPSGIAIAAFLIAERRWWTRLAVVLGCANVVWNLVHGMSIPIVGAFLVANILETLVG